jgi:hypothetical protein
MSKKEEIKRIIQLIANTDEYYKNNQEAFKELEGFRGSRRNTTGEAILKNC